MADNVAVTAGAGTSIATDDVGGAHYQRVKIDGGGDGAAAPIVALTGFDAAAATPPAMLAAGQPDRRYSAVTLAAALNSVQSWDTNGSDALIVHIATTRTGSIVFEVSADGTNWVNAEVRDTQTDLWVSGTSITPTANKTYRIISNGWRAARARVNSALNGTTDLTATLAARSTVLNALDNGPAPHAFGYAAASATAQYAGATTSTTLGPTVSSTQRMVVTSIQIQAGGTTAGTVQVYFGTGAYSRGTSKAIFDGEFAPSATSKPGFAQSFGTNPPTGAADEELKVTSSAVNPLTVTVWYYLIPV